MTIDPVNASAINARLLAVGYPGQPVTTGLFANPVHSTNVLGKIDHQVSGRDQLTLRYSLYDVVSSNSRGAGGLSAPSASAALDNRDHTISVSNTWTLSAHMVNETRVQFVDSNLKAPATDQIGPAVTIAGVATFGTLSASPQARLNRMFQLVDSASYQRGSHALRAGVDFLFNDDTIDFPRAYRGSYAFSSLPTFLAGLYNNLGFTQTFGVTGVHQTNPNLGLYAQDEWKPTSQLTINAGVRYDLQWLDTIHTDSDNVAPRLGFAWSPTASRRTLVRGGAGLYFDRVPLRALANALLSAGNTTDLGQLRQVNVSLSPAQTGAPSFPNILPAAVSPSTLVSLTTMDPNLQNAYSRQANVEVEQQIGRRATISAGYQYVRGTGLLMSINQNVPTCVAAGANNGCRPISSYASNSQYSAAGSSVYHGLHVSLVQRPASWWSYRVSYTLSSSMNDVGEFFFSSPIDPADLSKDWGRSDDDQRHRLVVDGSIAAPSRSPATLWQTLGYGWRVSGMLQAYSAQPFNITSGLTTIQGTAARPVVNGEFISRNAGVADDFFSLNLRLARSFPLGNRAHLEGGLEAFNVTNHRNDVTRNTNFGPGSYPDHPLPTFNQITGVGDPRALQVFARMTF